MAQTEANRADTTTVGSLLRYVQTVQNDLRGRPRRQDLLWCASIRIRTVKPESRERAVEFLALQGVVISLPYIYTYTQIYK